MKVSKGDVLTFRFKVEDPALCRELLSGLLSPMGSGQPYYGLMTTASARGDVFKERDAADELLGDVAEYLASGHTHDEDARALLDRIELPPREAQQGKDVTRG